MRPECLWILCPPCAQRRLGHKGRWELPGKLVGLGLLGALGGRGERFGPSLGHSLGNIRMSAAASEGIPPGHPWGSPPLGLPDPARGIPPLPVFPSSLPLSRSPRGSPSLPRLKLCFLQGGTCSVGTGCDAGRCHSPYRRHHRAFLVRYSGLGVSSKKHAFSELRRVNHRNSGHYVGSTNPKGPRDQSLQKAPQKASPGQSRVPGIS